MTETLAAAAAPLHAATTSLLRQARATSVDFYPAEAVERRTRVGQEAGFWLEGRRAGDSAAGMIGEGGQLPRER